MSEYQEILKHYERIHNLYAYDCDNCPLSMSNNSEGVTCGQFMLHYPKEAEALITKWAKDNPILTNADKFKEVFGVEIAEKERCPIMTSYCHFKMDCSECKYRDFWYKDYLETMTISVNIKCDDKLRKALHNVE